VNMFKSTVMGAVVAALVLTTTTALAGSGVGGVFNLGQVNTVDAQTSLSGNPGGNPELKVTSNGTAAAVRGVATNGIGTNGVSTSGVGQQGLSSSGIGTLGTHGNATGISPGVQGETNSTDPGGAGVVGKNNGGGPGLKAIVNPGAPPIAVNSGVKVANLNADLFDGLDSPAFQKRVSGTCAAGSAVKAVNADGTVTCEPVGGGGVWSLNGNSGTSDTNFLGTTDNQMLQLVVNGQPALRLEPNAFGPDLIGGYAGNDVSPGVAGASLAGGGAGNANLVTDHFGTIGGGDLNTAGDVDAGNDPTSAVAATVAGGESNNANGSHSSVGGGSGNTASGDYSVVGGGESNQASHTHSNVAGGNNNQATGGYSAVGGGEFNIASYPHSTVAGGSYNTASGQVDGSATVGGGASNAASGDYSAIGGGWANSASYLGAVAGGQGNAASGAYSAVAGGSSNTASGNDSAVGGGASNAASGDFSFAAGRRAKATQTGSFVWGDFTSADLTSPAANTFTVRASGGIWLGTTSTPSIPANHFLETSTGGYLSSGGIWTDNSDRALKHDFRPLDKQDVLGKVARMPITSWSYKAEKPSVRHIGPMAQDFYKAFGLGLDNKHIGTIDEGGVALAAIQGLYHENQALERQNAALSDRLRRLESTVAGLKEGGR